MTEHSAIKVFIDLLISEMHITKNDVLSEMINQGMEAGNCVSLLIEDCKKNNFCINLEESDIETLTSLVDDQKFTFFDYQHTYNENGTLSLLKVLINYL